MSATPQLKSSVCQAITKESLSVLSFQEKISHLNAIRISYPKLLEALNLIEECQNSLNLHDKPRCLRIAGPSGVGKTSLYEIHKRKNAPIETCEGIEIPVFFARVPCPARIGSLPESLLEALNDPFCAKRASIAQKTHRLYKLLNECKVKIIFLDEVQHLVDRNSQLLLRDSSDWFKELIDETRIPIVFSGMPDSRRIFLENEQLANRVHYSIELDLFKNDNEFRNFLYAFDGHLPLKEYSGLANHEFSQRIFEATNGLIKSIRDLIVDSSIIALNANSEHITMPMLAAAYKHYGFCKDVKKPFLPGYELN